MRTGALILFLLFSCYCDAALIRVKPGKDAIKKAIAAANVGDELIISAGTYKEQNILVNKRLIIKGENFPVIDGELKEQLIVITADHVEISGLQVENSGRSSMSDMAAIRVQNASYALITKNRIINNTYGVYLQNASGCTIIGNTIQSSARDELNSGNGIHAWKSGRLKISDNTISGHRDGIYFEFVENSYVANNHASANVRYGLHFMFSHHDMYFGNVFSNNGSGVAVMYSKHVSMLFNQFINNWGEASYAILMKEISDSRVERNIFRKNTAALYFEGTNRIIVKNNNFIENGYAARVQANCSENVFESNNFLSNTFDVATSGTLVLNTFKRNYWDKYDGYDLNKNEVGDVPYYPVSLYSVITENVPSAMILFRSFFTNLMDEVEKVLPSVTPDQLKDEEPLMKRIVQ